MHLPLQLCVAFAIFSGCFAQTLKPPVCPTTPCRPLACNLLTQVAFKPPTQCCPICVPKPPPKKPCNFKGKVYKDGVSFKDLCNTCRCSDGLPVCSKVPCPAPPTTRAPTKPTPAPTKPTPAPTKPVLTPAPTRPILTPAPTRPILTPAPTKPALTPAPTKPALTPAQTGSGCLVNGTKVMEGAPVPSKMGPCESCKCFNGSVRCEPMKCMPCVGPTLPAKPGQCCPICNGTATGPGCLVNSTKYMEGAYVPSKTGNPCESCVCLNGSLMCAMISCPACEGGLKMPGLCCPICAPGVERSCFYKGGMYMDGVQFKDECNVCMCLNGSVQCKNNGCPETGCVFNGVPFKEGSPMPSMTGSPCEKCQCRNGSVQCERMMCPACVGPIQPGQCCPTCANGTNIGKQCTFKNRTYYDGEQFKDECNMCGCSNGSVKCTEMKCLDFTERGSGCVVNGVTFTEGAPMPSMTGSPCEKCQCRNASVQCDWMMCAACDGPILPGQCCPTCANGTSIGPCFAKLAEVDAQYNASNGMLVGLERPLCDANGTFRGMQFSGSQAYCVAPGGFKISGFAVNRTEAVDMDCQCARDQDAYQKTGMIGLRFSCDRFGNYARTGCKGSVCFCQDRRGYPIGNAQVDIGQLGTLKC